MSAIVLWLLFAPHLQLTSRTGPGMAQVWVEFCRHRTYLKWQHTAPTIYCVECFERQINDITAVTNTTARHGEETMA